MREMKASEISAIVLYAVTLVQMLVLKPVHSQSVSAATVLQVSVGVNSSVRVKTTLSDFTQPLDIDFGDAEETPRSASLLPFTHNPIYSSLTAERVDDLINCKRFEWFCILFRRFWHLVNLNECNQTEVRHNFCPLSKQSSFLVEIRSLYQNISDVYNASQVSVEVDSSRCEFS
jgi:hypothetical protein